MNRQFIVSRLQCIGRFGDIGSIKIFAGAEFAGFGAVLLGLGVIAFAPDTNATEEQNDDDDGRRDCCQPHEGRPGWMTFYPFGGFFPRATGPGVNRFVMQPSLEVIGQVSG